MYIDFHTHRLRYQEMDNVQEIVSLHLGKSREHNLFTVGKHPWWTEQPLTLEEQKEFRELLSQSNCLAMGEMGLDKLKGPSLDIQQEVLRSQLRIAAEMKKPVIIHCVRAYNLIQQIKKEFSTIQKWCIHGYPRHLELALQLIQQDFYLSLMPVKEVTEKYEKLVSGLPLNRFFLETDSLPTITIQEVYEQVATIRGISVKELQEQMKENVNQFFYE